MLDLETSEYKTHLESLTTRELVKLADQEGIDIPPDLDRIFIIRELLDNIYDEVPAPENLSGKPDIKTAALPEQYHITYLEILPRDPQWVYVFWEIKAQDRERYEWDPRFEGYTLRAMESKNPEKSLQDNLSPGEFTEFFSVPVKPEDHSWYLNFPEGGIFCVDLWVRGLDISLILSRPFMLPRFLNNPKDKEYLNRPLIQLSGAADYTVPRNTDKVFAAGYE